MLCPPPSSASPWFASASSAQLVAYVHQRESEQVQPAPLLWILGAWIVGAQTDAPDLVAGARFHEDALLGAEQKVAERLGLRELGDVSCHHDRDALLLPERVLKAADFSTERLGSGGAARSTNSFCRLVILEQLGLAEHHVV